jgi:hypothetical protein
MMPLTKDEDLAVRMKVAIEQMRLANEYLARHLDDLWGRGLAKDIEEIPSEEISEDKEKELKEQHVPKTIRSRGGHIRL